jgi:thymidylate kinase
VTGRAARRQPGAVIAISGLDGSGKSTQARALSASLSRHGYDPVVVWHRLTFNPSLLRVTAPLRLALRLAVRFGVMNPPPPQVQADGDPIPTDHSTTRAFRERLPVLSVPWVMFVALVHAIAMRRATVREVRRGRVVIHDRYLLDALVELHGRYATVHGIAAQSRLLRRLTPRPLVAYLLDLPAEEAHRRKPEEFSVAELRSHRDAYLREATSSGVHVLDARCAPEDLAARISGQVSEALSAMPPAQFRHRAPWRRRGPRGAWDGGGRRATTASLRAPVAAADPPSRKRPPAMG